MRGTRAGGRRPRTKKFGVAVSGPIEQKKREQVVRPREPNGDAPDDARSRLVPVSAIPFACAQGWGPEIGARLLVPGFVIAERLIRSRRCRNSGVRQVIIGDVARTRACSHPCSHPRRNFTARRRPLIQNACAPAIESTTALCQKCRPNFKRNLFRERTGNSWSSKVGPSMSPLRGDA